LTYSSDPESEKWIEMVAKSVEMHLPEIKEDSPRVKIAILDTGYEANNPSINEERSRIKDSISFVDGGVATTDVVGHGTHALGLLLQFAPHADVYVAQIANTKTLSMLDWPRVAKVSAIILHVLGALRLMRPSLSSTQ
jgi:hypothetical protein